jgi:type I restriction enzyme R subunit
MTDDEIAFYDALALNDSAVEVLGDTKLKVIAHEVLESLKKNVTTDWQHRENARARLRTTVKKILKRYGYPPDLQDEAVKTVLAQAEALASSLTE